jgi:hypothetical protein
MSAVVFDPAGWIAAYPQFGISTVQAQAIFDNTATLMLNNTDASIITDIPTRTKLFNLLVAHIAQLQYGADGSGPVGFVGRLTSASEGSVSIGIDASGTPDAAWYMQTPFGFSYWTATTRYRRMRYRIGPRPRLSGLGPGYGLPYGY